MSTLLLSKLEEFLQPLFLTGAEYPSPRFGHIQVPPYRTGTGDLMESIRLALENSKVTREMLFVVPNVERSLLPPNVEKNHGSVTPVILTFSELLDALRTTKSMAQEEELWSPANSSWESGQPLPGDLVLVLCLDPLMSAECALCLVGIVKWAREASEESPMADVRVITVSAEPNFNFLAEVVSYTSPGTNVTKLDLAALGEQDPERDSVELQKNRDHKSLILSFDGGFEAEFKNVLSGREKELIDFVRVEATRDARPLLNLACSDKGPRTLFISFVGEVPFQPLDIHGFDKLHVVLGSSPIAGMDWHDASRQLVSLKQPPSREDRNLQIRWIHQPSIPERFLYAGVKALPLLAGLGLPRNRLVEGVQLGGFIASLADIASWGISVDRTLTCFVRPTHRVHEMTLKLHAQRLMEQDRFELSGREADVFRAVLPTFAYDHRLALLVALEAGPDVRRVKVQLALMLKHGMNKMLSFTGKAINDSTQYSKLLKECHGLGSSMARNGVMWLSLGILKRHQKMTEQRADYDPKKDRLYALTQIDPGKAEVFGVEVGKMLALLADLGVDVDTSKSVTHETGELSSEAQDEINLHLLRAYAHSLIVSEDRGRKDAPRICHKVVSTLIDSNMIRAAELHERNSRPVKQGEFQFGISHEMFVDNKSVGHLLLDWTSIPFKTVAQWRSSFGQNVTLKELLDVRVEYRRQVR
ncbi:hypothetical protein FCIRC_6380 [Fusarium circinatum]|uniref:Uncharacterized protein n=1 Tax=Fusarium circinatum TaxID=48490 RepID=A0A8H5X0E5_FUSCI|nr:hypothetical protein FCIRC_6380 [Fusarium circinatum]